MGLFMGIFLHGYFRPFIFFRVPIVFALAPPMGSGTMRAGPWPGPHGHISGISTAFNPGAAQPLHAGQCIVSHYLPGQRLCRRRCQRRPCAGKIARRGKLQGFPRVVAHTARIALLSGWLSVLLVCNFQGTARGIRSPSLSSRKLRSVNTLISRNFQKTF